jgi:hypothetical protein
MCLATQDVNSASDMVPAAAVNIVSTASSSSGTCQACPVTFYELDERQERRPLIAVGEAMMAYEPVAQYAGLGHEVWVELLPAESCGGGIEGSVGGDQVGHLCQYPGLDPQ